MNLFKDHIMSMVTDLNILGPNINNKDLLTIACVSATDASCKHPNVYNASILMPTTEQLMAWTDGNQFALTNWYPQYLLNDKDADDMIVALIAALTKKNVILYIPKDEYEVFGQILLNHIYYVYGITLQTPVTNFYFNMSKIPLILSKFYMMDIMDLKDYIECYPYNIQLPPFVINKMAEEFNPFNGQPATFEQYANYFNNIVLNRNKSQEKVNFVSVVDK